MRRLVSKFVGILLVVLIFCFIFRVNFVRADTYNQIPLWINVMAGSTISDDQIDNIEKEMDAVLAKAGLNWRVTSVVVDENYPDPDTSEDEVGDVRVGPEEDGLYRNGKKEVKDKAGVKIFVVRKILNSTGGNSGYVGGAEIVPGTRSIVVVSNFSDGSPVGGQVWAHELGHILGLGHKSNGTERPETDLMHRYALGGTNLTDDDVATMNQTKIARDLGLPSLTNDQIGRTYDTYHSEEEDLRGDSFYDFTDIFDAYFSFFILDGTHDLYVNTLLGGLIPEWVGLNLFVAMDSDNDPATGEIFDGFLGVDHLMMIEIFYPDFVEGTLYKYPTMEMISPLETRIETHYRHRCSEGPPPTPTVPLQNSIVLKVPIMLLGPVADPVNIGMSIQSADGLGTDRLETTIVPTSSPARPILTLEPPVAPIGSVVSASGSGFAPSNSVSIVFDHLNLSTTTVNPDGTFSTAFTIPNLPPDHYMVDAIDDSHSVGVSMFTITSPPWDITGPAYLEPDGKCDMRDIGLVAVHFGQTVPPAPVACDITGPTYLEPDGKVDMRDVGLVAVHFGEAYN